MANCSREDRQRRTSDRGVLRQWATAYETARMSSCWALQRGVVKAARRINSGHATEDSFEQP